MEKAYEVCREVEDYFKNRIKEAGWSRTTLEGLSFPTLSYLWSKVAI